MSVLQSIFIQIVLTLEELLFQFGLCDLDLDRLVYLLRMSSLVVGVVLDGRGEQGIDEGGLSEAGLPSNLIVSVSISDQSIRVTDHDGECSASLCDDLVSLVGKVCDANGRRNRLGGDSSSSCIWTRSHVDGSGRNTIV